MKSQVHDGEDMPAKGGHAFGLAAFPEVNDGHSFWSYPESLTPLLVEFLVASGESVRALDGETSPLLRLNVRKALGRTTCVKVAERMGFEPTIPFWGIPI